MYLNNYSVYVLAFPNNKHYVGATRQKPERRWRNGKGYGKHTRIGKAIVDNVNKNIFTRTENLFVHKKYENMLNL